MKRQTLTQSAINTHSSAYRTESRLESGIEGLAMAVIQQALRELGKSPTGRRWFFEPNTGFAFWCDVVGVNTELMRVRIGRMLEEKGKC